MKVADFIRMFAGLSALGYMIYQFYATGKEPSRWVVGVVALLIVGKMSDLTDLVKAFKGKNND